MQGIKECDGGSLRDNEGSGTAVNGEEEGMVENERRPAASSNEDECRQAWNTQNLDQTSSARRLPPFDSNHHHAPLYSYVACLRYLTDCGGYKRLSTLWHAEGEYANCTHKHPRVDSATAAGLSEKKSATVSTSTAQHA